MGDFFILLQINQTRNDMKFIHEFMGLSSHGVYILFRPQAPPLISLLLIDFVKLRLLLKRSLLKRGVTLEIVSIPFKYMD